MPINIKSLSYLSKFLFVGICVALINFFVSNLCLRFFSLSISLMVSYILGNFFYYYLHFYFLVKYPFNHYKGIRRFLVFLVAQYFIILLIGYVLVDLGINPSFSFIIFTSIMLPINYIFTYYFLFKK